MYAKDCIDPEIPGICGYCLEIHDPNPQLSAVCQQLIVDILGATEVLRVPGGVYVKTLKNPGWRKVPPVRLLKVFFLGK